MNVDYNSGCYVLIIVVKTDRTIAVGALGDIRFRKGIYLYVGRAKKNLKQRVNRHLATKKKMRWHIDYLLQHFPVESTMLAPILNECLFANDLATCAEASIVDRFGSSDCKCESHLIHFESLLRCDEALKSLEKEEWTVFPTLEIQC